MLVGNELAPLLRHAHHPPDENGDVFSTPSWWAARRSYRGRTPTARSWCLPDEDRRIALPLAAIGATHEDGRRANVRPRSTDRRSLRGGRSTFLPVGDVATVRLRVTATEIRSGPSSAGGRRLTVMARNDRAGVVRPTCRLRAHRRSTTTTFGSTFSPAVHPIRPGRSAHSWQSTENVYETFRPAHGEFLLRTGRPSTVDPRHLRPPSPTAQFRHAGRVLSSHCRCDGDARPCRPATARGSDRRRADDVAVHFSVEDRQPAARRKHRPFLLTVHGSSGPAHRRVATSLTKACPTARTLSSASVKAPERTSSGTFDVTAHARPKRRDMQTPGTSDCPNRATHD